MGIESLLEQIEDILEESKTTLGGGKMLASPKRAGKHEPCGPGEEKRGE